MSTWGLGGPQSASAYSTYPGSLEPGEIPLGMKNFSDCAFVDPLPGFKWTARQLGKFRKAV